MEKTYIDFIYDFFFYHNKLTLIVFTWLGAFIGHILSIYDKDFKGIRFIVERLYPKKKEIFYERIDLIFLPIIGCVMAFILIEPSHYKNAFFAGLTWSGALVAILKQKGQNNG